MDKGQRAKLIDNLLHVAAILAISSVGFLRFHNGNGDPFIPLIFVALYAILVTLGQIRRLMIEAREAERG